MNRTLPGPARDVALLIARLLLGTIMFAHGYQKLMIYGLGRTTEGFQSMSIPAAIVSAAFVTVVEVVGGVLVILGALLTIVAFCYLVVMVGAAVFVHIPHGVFVQNNGWELVGVIAALLLALAAAGSGRYGVDAVLRRRQAQVNTSISATAATEEMLVPAPRRPLEEAPDRAPRADAFFRAVPDEASPPPPSVPSPRSPAGPAPRSSPALSSAPLPDRRHRSWSARPASPRPSSPRPLAASPPAETGPPEREA